MAEGADKEKEKSGQEEVCGMENKINHHNHNNCAVVETNSNSNSNSGREKISVSISPSKVAHSAGAAVPIPIPIPLQTMSLLENENNVNTTNDNRINNTLQNHGSKSQSSHLSDDFQPEPDPDGDENVSSDDVTLVLSLNRHGEYASETESGYKSQDSLVEFHKNSGENNDQRENTGEGVESDDNSRRHLKSSSLPHGVKLCPESKDSNSSQSHKGEVGAGPHSGTGPVSGRGFGTHSNVSGQDWGEEDDESKCDKWAVLEEELRKAHSQLEAKDIEVEKLKGIRQQVEGELTDLTAALFEEAHKMVQAAKMKEASSEKNLKEAKMQLDGLQAEVAALKTLLITSTPSRPNLGGNGISIFKKQHKRCPSHNHLQYGRCEDEAEGKEKRKHHDKCADVVLDRERCEVDPNLFALFGSWRQEPTLSVNHNNNKSQFLQKIYTEDIDPCLSFSNDPLVRRLRQAVEENSIWVEPIPEKEKTNIPTECALVRCPRICHYRMRFAYDSDEWFDISQLCRDRIAAVCEFLNYLRYIKNGLVKASVDDAYWEIISLRKQMALAKLGIPLS